MLKRDDLQVLGLEPLGELGPDGGGHLALLASHREPALQKRDVLWVKCEAHTILCSLGCCPQKTKTTNLAQQAAGGHSAKVCNLCVSFALVLRDRRTS